MTGRTYDEKRAQSAADFESVVFPRLVALGLLHTGGDLVSVERDDSPVAKTLDSLVGIDYLHVVEQRVRSIAARCQRGPKGYANFTLNCAAKEHGPAREYEKLLAVFGDPYRAWMLPSLVVQAHLSDLGSLWSVGMIYTTTLLSFAVRFPTKLQWIANGETGGAFRCAWLDDLVAVPGVQVAYHVEPGARVERWSPDLEARLSDLRRPPDWAAQVAGR